MRFFGHFIPRSILLLVGLEGLLVAASLDLALLLQADPAALELDRLRLQLEVLGLAAAVVLAMALLGLYDPGQVVMRDGALMVDVRIATALLLVALAAALGYRVVPVPSAYSGLSLGLSLSFVALVAKRRVYRGLARSPRLKQRILVVGVGSRAAAVTELQGERSAEEMPYTVIGFVAQERSRPVDVPPEQVIVPAAGQDLRSLARAYEADELVVAVRERRGQLPLEELLDCRLHGITVTDLTHFLERERRQLRLDSLNTSSLIFGSGFRQGRLRAAVKRATDLAVSLALLAVTLPLMAATAVAIKLESRGPVLYRQERIGRGNRPYLLYKFRSMRADAERDGVPQWARQADDRITRVGRVIRKLRIDELPQILNVLRGEMSFVGPRPERPPFVEQLSQRIPFYPARHSVRPGITGWAQVCYPYGASVEDAWEKLQYDLYYVKNHTFFLDAVILVRTVAVVVLGQGAR
ncbi:TIGR03013 family XrtA/PEP-CTERM system glycosyltransferase [Halorhodospira neutriphila]|uniref:Sugar transferase n=1 Tax=Halorhodospira neutriphila TaxID=168379 RepID=A0ABS1E6L1_9GAMM|nr:sugar transferase [Halorhodospira neutriphila]